MSSYDDKIRDRIDERRARAERARQERKQQLVRQLFAAGIAIVIIVIIIVIIVKASGSKSDETEEISSLQTATEETAAEDDTDEEEDAESSGDETDYAGQTLYCTDNLNLRLEASTDSEVITVISEGEAVEVEETDGEWCKVLYGDTEGYLKLEYLSDEETEE